MQKKEIYIVKNNIIEDPLSQWLKRFAFEAHAFGHQHNDKDAVCDFRVIGDFELIFVVGGQSIIPVEQKIHKLKGGDMILIPPFTRHKIDTEDSDPHDNYWIHFDVFPFYRQNEFKDMLSYGINNVGVQMFSETLLPLLKQMENEMIKADNGSNSYVETLLLQLIISLLRNHYDENKLSLWNKSRSAAELDIVDRGMQFIQQNLEMPIQVKDICNHLHISESYLYKTYSKVMNLSPNYLIQLCKVKRAEQLLKTTSCSVKEISEMLCFSSQYYFSTVFKSFYGVSPRQYYLLNRL